MNKKTKLLILILLSLSVYFIYQQTHNKIIKITSIGDAISKGINSYGIEDTSYIDYYTEYLTNNNKQIELNKDYSKKDLTIYEILEKVKTSSKLKRELIESHKIFITIGYNDLLYQLSITENINKEKYNNIIKEISNNFNNLINEIRKYNNNDIIVVGYFPSNKDDYYLNKGIIDINSIFQNNKEVIYIDTYNLLKSRKKYFSNPNSYYPNSIAYREISSKIIIYLDYLSRK